MKLSHRSLILLSGFIWLSIGIALFCLGVRFFSEVVKNPVLSLKSHCFSVVGCASSFARNQIEAALLCMVAALLIGYVKGRTAFAKAAKRQLKRIDRLPSPASPTQLYGKGYILLIALMILLGISMRFLPITLDTRGFVDIAVGFGLVQGAMHYFRAAAHPGFTSSDTNRNSGA